MQFCQECFGRNRLRWINLHFVAVLRMQKNVTREKYVDERDKTDARAAALLLDLLLSRGVALVSRLRPGDYAHL